MKIRGIIRLTSLRQALSRRARAVLAATQVATFAMLVLLAVIALFAAIATFSDRALADPAPAPPGTAPAAPPPPRYVCARAAEPPSIDGKLDDPAWQKTAWTNDFVDIATAEKTPLATRAKLLWDDANLYVAADLREPHLRARIAGRDQYVYRENAFEIFIDPDGDNHDYAEVEINAINTVTDLRLDKPYRDGGKADLFWDAAGMRTAVRLDGTLNEATDQDKGWTIEVAIPWHALAEMGGREVAPAEGSQWRINLARVEHPPVLVNGQYHRTRGIEYWCWSPQMEVNLHAPERWGFVQFSADAQVPFKTDSAVDAARDLLMRTYHAQSDYRQIHNEWSTRLEDLQKQIGPIPPQVAEMKLVTTPRGWEATAALRTDRGLQMWHVRQDSKLWRE